jgi:hypothetical protein
MIKSVKILITTILCVACILSLSACNYKATEPTEPINDVELTEPTTQPTTEPGETKPTVVIPDDVCGIPGDMFKDTIDREFDFSIQSPTNDSWNIGARTPFGALSDGFVEPTQIEGVVMPVDVKVAPDATQISAMFADNTDGVFVFGVVNDSGNDSEFHDCGIVYISYSGTTPWSLCGLSTNMTKQQAIDAIGVPTQSMKTSNGYTMEWYVYREGHSYLISALMDDENGTINKIILNIDNHAVYAGVVKD